MKNIIYASLAILLFVINSCNDDRESGLNEDGQVLFQISLADIPETTKASELPGMGDWNPADNCVIEIVKGENVLHTFSRLSDVPSTLTLAVGEYTLTVAAGTEKGAGFDHCYYEGKTTFSVEADETATVSFVCKLKNVLTTIHFTDELISLMDDGFEVYIIGETMEDKLSWDKDNSGDTGYFILTDATDLAWAVEGNLKDKNIVTRSGVISSVKPNTNYILTFNYEDGLSTGDLSLTLEIVESDPEEDTIDYTPGTTIEGGNFDLNNPASIEEGSDQPIVVTIESTTAIANIVLTVNDITKSAFGLNDSVFDFMQMDPAEIAQYASKGIIFSASPLARSGNSDESYSITIAGEKIKELAIGDYSFDIAVTNKNGTVEQATLTLPVIGIALVSTENIVQTDVWATKVTIKGTLSEQTDLPLSFDYRERGMTAWSTVAATLSGNQISANIIGLQGNTTYEYCVKAGEQVGEIKEFTTEVAAQLPNPSFERWQAPNFNLITNPRGHKDYWIYGEGEEPFWDSGNEGATTVSASSNLTTPDESISGEGEGNNTSAKLRSRWITIKFAAGNMFAGNYVKTVGMSGAQLDFGRPFTSRPSRMTGLYKYTGGVINRAQTTPPQKLIDEGAALNQPDKGIVYVALGDWAEPVRIDNSASDVDDWQLFDKENDPHIIAFGEMVQVGNTTGDGLHPFSIDLKYRDLTRIPTHIVIVCSASMYGDYFIGCDTSVLWVDDFELIYE